MRKDTIKNQKHVLLSHDIDIDIADRAGRIRAIEVNDELMETDMNLRFIA
jgi:hypothetical protein